MNEIDFELKKRLLSLIRLGQITLVVATAWGLAEVYTLLHWWFNAFHGG